MLKLTPSHMFLVSVPRIFKLLLECHVVKPLVK